MLKALLQVKVLHSNFYQAKVLLMQNELSYYMYSCNYYALPCKHHLNVAADYNIQIQTLSSC